MPGNLITLLKPVRLLILSFAALITVGSLIFCLPACSTGVPLPFVDAFFLATSAVCVTGLSPIDIGTRLTPLGQIVALFLIQLGGIGIITFSTVIVISVGRFPSVGVRAVLEETYLPFPSIDFFPLLRSILTYTACIEGAGALVLFCRWVFDFPAGRALWLSIFHAISAFCNSGFSLFPDSLASYRGDTAVNLVVMALIFLGGIGFMVQFELWGRLMRKERHILAVPQTRSRRLTLHTRTVLTATAVLVAAVAVFVFLNEFNQTMAGLSLKERILASLFHSVAPRTAGFSTLNCGAMRASSLFVIMAVMFIGASPGGTGGGVKTTTAMIVFALARSKYRGREKAELFNRTIPETVVDRALHIIIIALVVLFVMTAMLYESDAAARYRALDLTFEAVSAFGTVGLSTGITPHLTIFGKLVIIALMFIGRIGPLTVAAAIGKHRARGRYSYPDETIMVG